jgi:hypothetical protein
MRATDADVTLVVSCRMGKRDDITLHACAFALTSTDIRKAVDLNCILWWIYVCMCVGDYIHACIDVLADAVHLHVCVRVFHDQYDMRYAGQSALSWARPVWRTWYVARI